MILESEYEFPGGIHLNANMGKCGPEPTVENMQVLRLAIQDLERQLIEMREHIAMISEVQR